MKRKKRKPVASIILALMVWPLMVCASVDDDKSEIATLYKDWSSFIKKGKIEEAVKLMQERSEHQIYKDLQIKRLKRAHEQSNGKKKVELIGEAYISDNVAMIVIREGDADYDPVYFIKADGKWLMVYGISSWTKTAAPNDKPHFEKLEQSFKSFKKNKTKAGP